MDLHQNAWFGMEVIERHQAAIEKAEIAELKERAEHGYRLINRLFSPKLLPVNNPAMHFFGPQLKIGGAPNPREENGPKVYSLTGEYPLADANFRGECALRLIINGNFDAVGGITNGVPEAFDAKVATIEVDILHKRTGAVTYVAPAGFRKIDLAGEHGQTGFRVHHSVDKEEEPIPVYSPNTVQDAFENPKYTGLIQILEEAAELSNL